MIIYLDLVFLLNFIIDFMLLLTVNIALKRYVKIYKLLIGALIGSISLLSLFIPFNSFTLLVLKIFMGVFMSLVAFSYKNIKYTFYNVAYLFMCSVILGGFLYFLKFQVNYNSNGFVFYYNGLAINYLALLLFSPLILYLFIKSLKVLKEVKNYYYDVEIIFKDNNKLNITGFLDTGNKLKDPLTNKPVIIINRKIIKGKFNIRSPMYIPFNALNTHGLLECIKPKYVYINKKELKNILVGFSDNSFKLNGIDCLLNYYILEELND